MGVFYFPANFVYWRKVPDHKIFKEKILKHLNENINDYRSHGLINNGITTHNNLKSDFFLRNYDEFIKSVVWDTLDEFLEHEKLRENTPKMHIIACKIHQCWCSVYDKNGSISLHNHTFSGREIRYDENNNKWLQTFTLLYIINDENEKNQTEFIQPSLAGVSSHLYSQTTFKTYNYKDIGEGTVLIFPSSLNHQVKDISSGGRVIFSCDIVSCYDTRMICLDDNN